MPKNELGVFSLKVDKVTEQLAEVIGAKINYVWNLSQTSVTTDKPKDCVIYYRSGRRK